MRSRLLAHFAPDVRKLSHLTGRDLSEWLGDGPPKSRRSSGLEAGVQTA
jgi:hypothetical protein